MKKVAILFLLATVLAAFTFGQVSVKEELQLTNVGGGNGGDLSPTFITTADAAGAKELGPGSLGFAAELQYKWALAGTPDGAAGDGGYAVGDNFLEVGYSLAAGPGTLRPFVRLHEVTNWRIGADYTDLAVGPVVLGFGAFFDYPVNSAKAFDGVDKEFIEAWITVSALDSRLNVKYAFDFGIGDVAGADGTDSGVKKIVYLDVNFKVMDPLVVGLEVDDTGDSFEGFTLNPYANYSLSENTTLGAHIAVKGINAPSGDITFNPGVSISYTF